MKIRSIKDVDEETWRNIKDMSRREKLNMGMLLKEMVKEYKRRPSTNWNKILNVKPILTGSEAEDMKKIISKVRHEYGFRK